MGMTNEAKIQKDIKTLPVLVMAWAIIIGANEAPVPKKKCRPFIAIATFLPYAHVMRLFPPVSTVPSANPKANNTKPNKYKIVTFGINATIIADISNAVAKTK